MKPLFVTTALLTITGRRGQALFGDPRPREDALFAAGVALALN